MCGRYAIDLSSDYLAGYYGVEVPGDFTARYNVAPGQDVPVVCQDGVSRRLACKRWGLIPSWSNDPGKAMINARSETVAGKPFFQQAFRRRRAVLPASGFYEWRRIGNRKRPYYFRRVDDGCMSLAAIWERWVSPSGDVIESCAILTTVANPVVAPIHDRMPVILSHDDLAVWLDGELTEVEGLNSLLLPVAAEEILTYPVSTWVNSPEHDDPSCLQGQGRSIFDWQ